MVTRIGTATIVNPPTRDEWPAVGHETLALLETPDILRMGDAANDVVRQARAVLARAFPAEARPGEVGLVTGYVQSGKTLNFTTVCALARDNGIPLIIIVTGISTNLFDQSNERIERDLRLLTRSDRRWIHVKIDTRDPSPAQRIIDTLADWADTPPLPDSRRQGVLITVMKNHRHLDYLVDVLNDVSLAPVVGGYLARSCSLVIDDEGDQASLNYLASRNRESTNYRHLGRLRRLLPHHAYLQYTATPQAPLLINLIDTLSPSFARVLHPGPGYTGNATFFPRGASDPKIVRTIPPTEIVAPGQALAAPPPSYRIALATFFVGVAVGELVEEGVGNRSMMVHPHFTTPLHGNYFVWAESLRMDWQRSLAAAEGDESRTEVTALFRLAYDDLASTATLPTWEEVLAALPLAMRRTSIHEVNATSGHTPTIPWRDRYAHILVGGQAMDRGYTVEGLTVTYMPRGPGEGNADTVQQRARFFGYKERYLGFCRVWLEPIVQYAFEGYSDHEESMRKGLERHSETGRPLTDWKRAFFLDRALSPTRRQVIQVAYRQGNHGERWVDPSRPHDLPDLILQNNATIDGFLRTLTLVADEGHADRTDAQRHRVAFGVPLRKVFEELLERLRLSAPADSLEHTALLLQLEKWLEDEEEEGRVPTCALYEMRRQAPGYRTRMEDDRLANFYQGAYPSTGPSQGSVYRGDRELRHRTDVTVQIHRFELRPHPSGRDQSTYANVALAATFVPTTVGRDWLVQR